MSRSSHPSDTSLTTREMQVLRLVSAGLSSKHIGVELGIAPKTVDTYVEHVRMKLGAINRIHMVALAVNKGLLDIGD